MFGWFHSMLDSQPVHLDENQIWQVFGYADVARILSDPATFSSDITAFQARHPDVDLFNRGNIVAIDPPQHRKLRTLISKAFTPNVVSGLAPRISQITMDLLDSVSHMDEFDFIGTLASPLPSTVIAELLGVPTQDHSRFLLWAEALFMQEAVDATTVLDEKLANAAVPITREMNEYLLAHISRRREQPTDDLTSKLTAAEVDGERLADEEILGFVGVLLLAGYVTTMALLGNAVLSFGCYPAAAAAVRGDQDLLPVAIEEVLRYRSPFPRLARVTTTATEVGGQALSAGQLVIPWLAAANRDPARFLEPDRFHIHRKNIGHLAFGHGIHFCIGAPLARLEARIALGILLNRYHDIALDPALIEFYNPWGVLAVKHLPVRVC